jgi:hypothetical protein
MVLCIFINNWYNNIIFTIVHNMTKVYVNIDFRVNKVSKILMRPKQKLQNIYKLLVLNLQMLLIKATFTINSMMEHSL